MGSIKHLIGSLQTVKKKCTESTGTYKKTTHKTMKVRKLSELAQMRALFTIHSQAFTTQYSAQKNTDHSSLPGRGGLLAARRRDRRHRWDDRRSHGGHRRNNGCCVLIITLS